jgi:hypothetical protein
LKNCRFVADMWRYRTSVTLLIVFSLSILLSYSLFGSSWDTGKEITANTSTQAPTIDGIKEAIWSENSINVTYHTFSGRQLAVHFAIHSASLYVLVETQFTNPPQNESICLFLSSSNSSSQDTFLDKKMLTLFKANQPGNESYITRDFYQFGDNNYILDKDSENFTGAAKIDNSNQHRIYEFRIPFTPTNKSYDITWLISHNYAIKLGINNSGTDLETSGYLLVQLGNRLGLSEENLGEFKFDTELFITIVSIIIAASYGVVGVVIIISKKNIEPISESRLIRRRKAEAKQEEQEEEIDNEENEEENE